MNVKEVIAIEVVKCDLIDGERFYELQTFESPDRWGVKSVFIIPSN
jgi:hypothetical protein